MEPRRAFGRTDIARENADVLVTACLLVIPAVLAAAIVGLVMAAAAGPHAGIGPATLFHHLAASGALASLPAPAALLAVTILAVTLESLVFGRAVFARGAQHAMDRALDLVRGLPIGSRRIEARPATPPVRRPWLLNDDTDHGILRQLRRALSIAPLAPPPRLGLVSGPSGPLAWSGHRAEVCTAA